MEKREGITKFFKRKTRSTESESLSPEHSRLKIDLNLQNTSGTGLSEGEDIVESALDMAQGLGEKLDLILEKLTKLETIESQIKDINATLERMNERIEEEVSRLDVTLRSVEEKTCELEASVEFIGKDLEDAKQKHDAESKKMTEEIHNLERKLLNLEVYQRRENLVFYGIPEKEFAEGRSEDTTEYILKDFLDDELEMPLPRSVKFQRVHRLGKTKGNGKPRPIIARFLNYPDVVKIMQLRKNLAKDSGFWLSPDLPRKVLELRKSQIPKMVAARKEGKMAFFSKAEPYRLIIDGQFVS